MQEIKTKALALIDRYREQLAAKGLEIVLSKKYVETEVEERAGGYAHVGQAIFRIFERASDRKKELKRGYHFEKNRYHSIVIAVRPLEKSLVSDTECREWAFVLKKVERAHLGLEPQKKSYPEESILAKIEKRILRVLKAADERPPQRICKNTFWDAWRYSQSPKYGYKDRFCGKERFTWDMICKSLVAVGVIVALVIVWMATSL